MKKLIAVILSALMLMSVAACGSGEVQTPVTSAEKAPAASDPAASSQESMGTGQEYVTPPTGET